MNNPPFSIGQKVVQLCDGIFGRTKKGDDHIVLGIKKGCCGWYIDIGQTLSSAGFKTQSCPRCLSILATDDILWSHARFFAPIQTNYSDATAEILEKFKSPAETPDKILTPEKVTNQ